MKISTTRWKREERSPGGSPYENKRGWIWNRWSEKRGGDEKSIISNRLFARGRGSVSLVPCLKKKEDGRGPEGRPFFFRVWLGVGDLQWLGRRLRGGDQERKVFFSGAGANSNGILIGGE